MDPYHIALAHTSNGALTAFVINCLKNQGALGDRQYENALRATIEAEGAERERLDYQFLANLLAALEKHHRGRPPDLDAVH
jgi:hypothetical protein